MRYQKHLISAPDATRSRKARMRTGTTWSLLENLAWMIFSHNYVYIHTPFRSGIHSAPSRGVLASDFSILGGVETAFCLQFRDRWTVIWHSVKALGGFSWTHSNHHAQRFCAYTGVLVSILYGGLERFFAECNRQLVAPVYILRIDTIDRAPRMKGAIFRRHRHC